MNIFLHVFAQKFVENILKILALRKYYWKYLRKFLRCTIFFAKKCGKKYGNFSAAKKISQIFTEFFAVRKIFCKKMRKKLRKQSQSPICFSRSADPNTKIKLSPDNIRSELTCWMMLRTFIDKTWYDYQDFPCGINQIWIV